MTLLAIVMLLAGLFVGPGRGATTAPPRGVAGRYTLDHALTQRSFSDLTWSRDGRRLAFVVSEPDTAEDLNNTEVYLADLERGDVRRMTRSLKPDVSPTFSPSGDTIAFVGNRGTGDDARAAIWMMSLRGGDPWPAGTFDEAIGEVAWSPDGRMLAYVKTDTLPRQIRDWRKKKWDHVIEDERLQYPHLWVMDLASGKRRQLVTGANYVWHVRWSPDSRQLAFLTSPTGAADDGDLVDIGVVAAAGGAVHTLGAIGDRFAWSPDGRWIAWASATHRDQYVEKQDVWVCAPSGGRPVNLTAAYDGDGTAPCWSAGSDTLFFHAERGVSTVVAAVPRTGGAVRLLTDRNAGAEFPVAHASGRTAWVQSTTTSPPEVFVADHPALAGRAITSLHADVTRLALGSVRAFQWTSSDGVRCEGVLIRPPGAPARGPLKTLVGLHGGPYGTRYDFGFQSVPQLLAARGYQVFLPNFRSSSGYGTAFMVRARADWGGQDWRDVTTGIDSLVRAGLADGKRLGVYGGSYGGFLSAWAITHTDRFRAAYIDRPPIDLAGLWAQSDVHKYRAFEFGGRPWESFDAWRRSSPIAHVASAKTPTLLIVGEDDRRTPIAQSQELYQSLKALGVPVQFVHYPREGHGLREPRHRADLLTRVLAWFDRWIT
jgi:dipeptidyl aminopeptidase/acylaminoacyl peptidase